MGKWASSHKKYDSPEKINALLPPEVRVKEPLPPGINSSTSLVFIDCEHGEYTTSIQGLKNAGFIRTHPKEVAKRRAKNLAASKGYSNNFQSEINTKKRLIAQKQRSEKIRMKNLQELKEALPSYITIIEDTFSTMGELATFVDVDYGEWRSQPRNVLKGGKHPKRRTKPNILTKEEFLKRLPPHVFIKNGESFKTRDYVVLHDVEYGDWSVKINNFLNGSEHPLRAKNDFRLQEEEFKARLVERSEISFDFTQYQNSHTPMRFIDNEFGEFWMKPYVLLNGGKHPNRRASQSYAEKELATFCNTLGEIVENKKFIIEGVRWEADIFFPNENFVIEFDGLYWHSEKRRDKNYHIKKREAFRTLGISTIFVREDEWRLKPEIIKSIISCKLGRVATKIYARTSNIKEVPTSEAIEFLDKNHLMGSYTSARYIGLFQEDVLVAILGYKKLKEGLDISRFCCKLNTIVVGGLSRLLKVIEQNNPKFIQSFVDLRYGDGRSLLQLGYHLDNVTPGWQWTDGFNTYNRLQCRANMDNRNLSEREHAEELRWYKIYDAGQAKFIKEGPWIDFQGPKY